MFRSTINGVALMQRDWRVVCLAWLLCAVGTAPAADWRQFRGPGGQGISPEKRLPVEWSSRKNIRWKTPLLGPGTSSPVTVGDRIYLTCYTGYALDPNAPGKMEDLRRHLVCVALGSGEILWTKQFDPNLPEHKYEGEGSYHGYSSSTPTSDGERLFVFFGKSGVFCFDLVGNPIWFMILTRAKWSRAAINSGRTAAAGTRSSGSRAVGGVVRRSQRTNPASPPTANV